MSGWTKADVSRVLASHQKPSKYKAVKTVVDGITFDSKKEAAYYHELKIREKIGEVRDIQVHYAFPLECLAEDGDIHELGCYEADFVYQEKGKDGVWHEAVDDVKGMKTLPLARWKQKHFAAQYGIAVREIR